MAAGTQNKEFEIYRGILEPATEFKDGFGWTTVVGIFFCGLIMMPGGIYLGLMTGGSLSTASSWVTVILFMEIARRAIKPMSQQNLVILLHAATIMMMANAMMPGGPLGWLVYRAYLVGSEAVRDAGMASAFPKWFCPPTDSPAITGRTFFHDIKGTCHSCEQAAMDASYGDRRMPFSVMIPAIKCDGVTSKAGL